VAPSASSRSSSPRAPASNASAATRSAAARSRTRTVRHANRSFALAALLLLLPAISGCYLSHLATGQLRLLRASTPIEEILADPETSPELREKLGLVEAARTFARELGLEVGDQYTRYAAWEGDRVVTTIVATRPGSVEPATFWFPIVGSVPYKGFFSRERAESEAARLQSDGMDVCLVPVAAYSTLGWFADPLTGPMLRATPGRLVETVLHELVHATVYLPEHADFNEGVATFVGEEASVRFWQARDAPGDARRRRLEVQDDRRIDAVRLTLREQVAALYEREAEGHERDARRAGAETRARAALADLDLETRDTARLATALRLNDACLAIAATYTADLPAYDQRLEALAGDLPGFISELRKASHASDPRAALLAE
jgi:predicted aminopeptidase